MGIVFPVRICKTFLYIFMPGWRVFHNYQLQLLVITLEIFFFKFECNVAPKSVYLHEYLQISPNLHTQIHMFCFIIFTSIYQYSLEEPQTNIFWAVEFYKENTINCFSSLSCKLFFKKLQIKIIMWIKHTFNPSIKYCSIFVQ